MGCIIFAKVKRSRNAYYKNVRTYGNKGVILCQLLNHCLTVSRQSLPDLILSKATSARNFTMRSSWSRRQIIRVCSSAATM